MTDLQTFFAETVRAGWRPVHPCTDPAELVSLEVSTVRGDCINPILQAGDVIFIDRNAKSKPGDVVSFALSQRGASAQNSCLPAGQSPWAAGSRWCKLLGTEHGLQMLYDRHGSAATATLMACESPDDVPALHPVRNIRRDGRLLFGSGASPAFTRRAMLAGCVVAPLALAGCNVDGVEVPELPAVDETSGAQIGGNAATQPYSVAVAGPDSFNAGTVPTAPFYYAHISGTGVDAASLLRATLTFDASQAHSGSAAQVFIVLDWGAGSQSSDIPSITQSATTRFAVQMSFTALPASTSWTMTVRIASSGSSIIDIENTLLLAEVIKR